MATNFNYSFSTSNPETKIVDLDFKSKRISPENTRFCFIANIEQDTYELVMKSINTLLINNNCDLLIDLGSKWLEESKDIKQIQEYFDRMSSVSKHTLYYLHSNRIDYSDDIIGKDLIADTSKDFIMTKQAQLKLLDDQTLISL